MCSLQIKRLLTFKDCSLSIRSCQYEYSLTFIKISMACKYIISSRVNVGYLFTDAETNKNMSVNMHIQLHIKMTKMSRVFKVKALLDILYPGFILIIFIPTIIQLVSTFMVQESGGHVLRIYMSIKVTLKDNK